MYCRVATEKQISPKDYGIAGKYYMFIQKYERYLKKYENYSTVDKSINPKYLDIISFMNKNFEEKYMPWRFLTKGKELEEMNKIFSSDNKEILRYLGIADMLHDDFYMLAEDELNKYYSKNKIEKTDEELFNEIEKFNFDRKFKRKVFSKETIELFRLYKEADPLQEELYTIFKQLQQKNMDKQIDCDIEEIEK